MRIIIKLISMFICILLVSCHSIPKQAKAQIPEANDTSTPCKPYTLTIVFFEPFTGEEIIQTIDIDEKETFRVSTIADKTKWTSSGVIGEVKNDHIPIELTTQWFINEKSNLTYRYSLKLKLDEDKMMLTGSLRGFLFKSSVVKN